MAEQTPSSRALLASILVLISALPGSGRETVEVKTLSFPKQAEISSIDLLIGKGEVAELKLQSHEFTLPVNVPRLAEWKFGKGNTDDEGRFTFTTYARVTPLAAGKQHLVFIRKGRKDEDGFHVIALNPAKLDGGNYLLTNLTGGEIGGVVGGEKFQLAPGRRAILKPRADRGENLCFSSLNYFRDGKRRSFFSSNWRLRERCRALVFIYTVPGERSPRIHSVIDPI